MRVFLISNEGRSYRVTGTLDAAGVPDPAQTGNLTPPMPSVEALQAALRAGLQACGQEARDAREFVYPRDRLTAPALPDRPEGG